MFEDLNKKASQTKFAALVGCSQQNVSQLINSGVLKKTGSYKVWMQVYIDHLRKSAAGRNDGSLTESRARESRANASLKEIELAKELQLVISTQQLGPMLSSLFHQFESQLNSASYKAVEAVETEHSIKLDEKLITTPIHSALRNLASIADELNGTVVGDNDGSIAAAVNT